jgi:hypothetical protein
MSPDQKTFNFNDFIYVENYRGCLDSPFLTNILLRNGIRRATANLFVSLVSINIKPLILPHVRGSAPIHATHYYINAQRTSAIDRRSGEPV